jgi:hypothetical protein
MAHSGCDRSAEDAYSSAAPDPTSPVSRGQCKPDFHCGLFYIPDLGTEFDCGVSIYLIVLTNFDYKLFRSPNIDTLNLTTDIWIWNGAHGVCDGQQGMLTPPQHLFLLLHLSEVRVPLHSICTCLLDYDYVLDIVNFAIVHYLPHI